MKQPTPFPALSILLLLWPMTFGHATTIRSVSVNEMLERAEFIFEGRVIDVEVQGGATAASIKTCASFEIIDILKGPPITGPIELCFAGGIKGSMRRRIHRMTYPSTGETGIYFVKSLDAKYAHPLYGWNQGYLRVRRTTASGAEGGVYTADGEAIMDVESRPEPGPSGLSTGVARGVVTRSSLEADVRGLAAEAFKARLRQMMKERP